MTHQTCVLCVIQHNVAGNSNTLKKDLSIVKINIGPVLCVKMLHTVLTRVNGPFPVCIYYLIIDIAYSSIHTHKARSWDKWLITKTVKVTVEKLQAQCLSNTEFVTFW